MFSEFSLPVRVPQMGRRWNREKATKEVKSTEPKKNPEIYDRYKISIPVAPANQSWIVQVYNFRSLCACSRGLRLGLLTGCNPFLSRRLSGIIFNVHFLDLPRRFSLFSFRALALCFDSNQWREHKQHTVCTIKFELEPSFSNKTKARWFKKYSKSVMQIFFSSFKVSSKVSVNEVIFELPKTSIS